MPLPRTHLPHSTQYSSRSSCSAAQYRRFTPAKPTPRTNRPSHNDVQPLHLHPHTSQPPVQILTQSTPSAASRFSPSSLPPLATKTSPSSQRLPRRSPPSQPSNAHPGSRATPAKPHLTPMPPHPPISGTSHSQGQLSTTTSAPCTLQRRC